MPPTWTSADLRAYEQRRRGGGIVKCPPGIAVKPSGKSTEEDRLNKLERAFLLHLRAEGYEWIGIQCITLKLAYDCRYTPDLWTHGQLGFRAWETKGPHAWEDSIIKLRVAARLYPMITFTLVRRDKSQGWIMQDIRP